ncbi:SDR family oxidoreductase [Rhizobium sp. 3T7]|uniref:SDR family oxidoreductase n=1 Tax=Rhizobium sp. 3T7 TaxID=2874922 RepID=UPI001CCC3AC7|nr:SDR family oxidoreductase [Rhizobium sp. 3T7]MBZ9793364.1 SDR family oxidoreductase [Rhizobium sp. 3T7]
MTEAAVSQSHTNPLAGKRVLIVGGTSGIGLAAARQARDAGAKVTVVGSDRERAKNVAAENAFEGWRAADITNTEAIYAALADVGHVDHLVLLAGSFVAGKVLVADVTYLRRAFEERIWASVHVLRALGDKLASDASITFISGALADRPNAYGTAVLAAASAAMEAFARGLAVELAPRRVNTLSPGPIDTPILSKTLGDGRDAYVQSLKQTLPLHRLGTAAEAGEAVVFLMGNGWMNGAVLNVDGGSRLV